MKTVTVTGRDGPVELQEFVEPFYLFSGKANRVLERLRLGLPTWVSTDVYNEMRLSLWTYNDLRVNGFSLCEGGKNYIALSAGLLAAMLKEAEEFVDKERLSLVFHIREDNKQHLKDTLYFFMANFAVAHEFGHIVHGHLRDGVGANYIDEMFLETTGSSDEEKRASNWRIQLREYDADCVAVAVQSLLFIQQWQSDIRANLSNFDKMFIANYLCFRTFAESMGRDFSDYMTKDVDAYDHPHPGIRMMYSLIHYYSWLIRLRGENSDTLAILESGCHAVIAYEKEVLETEKLKQCYFSVASTSKGVQHIMHLHNEWQKLVDHYNDYAFIPIETMENIDGMMAALDKDGSFFLKSSLSGNVL